MFKKGLALGLGLLLAIPLWAALEVGTYIDDLVVTNPTASDHYATADDHLRLIKNTIKNTFPNISGAVSTTQAELNILDGATLSTAELNTLDGVTSTAVELNALDGITATVTELNYTDGVTSAIQTQLNTLDTALDTKVDTSSFPNVNSAVSATDEQLSELSTHYDRAVKTSDTSRSSTTTITADPHLVLSGLAANSRWKIEAVLRTDGNTGGGLKLGWLSGGATATGYFILNGESQTGSSTEFVYEASSSGNVNFSNNPPTYTMVHLIGYITTGGATSSFSLGWAQVTSNASATSIKAGSWITAERMD